MQKRFHPFPAIIAALLALGPGTLCRASLEWETRQVELVAKPGDKEVTGKFHFTNSGSRPVAITSLQTSCGCTTAELAKRTYAPGESGEVVAVFKAGDALGRQAKSITVVTDDPGARPVELSLVVTIPEPIEYSPRILLWRIGDKLQEKSVLVAAPYRQALTGLEIDAVTPANEAIARIEPGGDGSSYRIHVRPTTSFKASQVAISGTVRFADQRSESFKIFVLVR